MKAVSRTHIGNVRPSNQDALLIHPGFFGLYGVADGMGGHKAGDVASRIAVEVVIQRLKDEQPSETLLRAGIEEANAKIYAAQLEDEALHGMGTTLTVVWEDEGQVLLGHVGDSRAYLLRNGELRQISHDHSMVAQLVLNGMLTPEEARRHPYRNIITRALGTDETVNVDILDMEKEAGDLYLICSDGLSEYVEEDQMRAVLLSQPLELAADTLLNLALEGGGRDNISLVLAEVEA